MDISHEVWISVTFYFQLRSSTKDQEQIFSFSQVLKDVFNYNLVILIWIWLISIHDTYGKCYVRSSTQHGVHEALYNWSIRDLTHVLDLFRCVRTHLLREVDTMSKGQKIALGVFNAEPLQHLLYVYFLRKSYHSLRSIPIDFILRI